MIVGEHPWQSRHAPVHDASNHERRAALAFLSWKNRRHLGMAPLQHLWSRLTLALSSNFDLLRWFAAISLVCIASTSIAGGFFLSHFLKAHMLERDAVVSMHFINSIVRAENSWPSFRSLSAPESLTADPVLASFFNHISRLPGVVRANIHAPDHTVLWSSTPQLIGQRFGQNDELEKALAGEVVVEWGQVGQPDKSEHINFDPQTTGARFVEAYLPIWNGDGKKVVAVAEIYKLPKELFESIDEGVRLIWASTMTGALLTYGALFWVVRRASAIVREKETQLVETETFTAIGEMASAVAHSIRNPLAAIRSSAELARIEDDPAVAEECLDDVVEQVDRVDHWVRELLGFARGGEPGTSGSATAEPIAVEPLLVAVVQGFATTIERRRIAVRREIGPLLPVAAGAGPVSQAFTTIVANALEAMPDGGLLMISAATTASDRMVEICIGDSGAGLPAELAAKVFRPFFTTKPNGLGLGLALTRRIIRRYGGEITFNSIEGRGTTVTVYLPVAPSRS